MVTVSHHKSNSMCFNCFFNKKYKIDKILHKYCCFVTKFYMFNAMKKNMLRGIVRFQKVKTIRITVGLKQ